MTAQFFTLRNIFLASVFAVAFILPQTTLAALQVDFQAQPLFAGANILPGDVVARTVTVKNTGLEDELVIFTFRNEFSDGLADVMELAVTDSSTTYADNYFTNLFALGEVDLGELRSGEQNTYTFTASLSPQVGNAYQLSEFGFDLVLGFASGETITDGGGGSGGNSGSGSGSSGGSSHFNLYNEAVTTPDNSSARLTWNTNRSATSYAVCGNTADGPFVLDGAAEFFGYQFASVEKTSKQRLHEVLFTDLAIGKYECRVASRQDVDDDFTVSSALRFQLLPPGQVEGISTSVPQQPTVAGNIFTPTGSVAGASTGGKGTFGGPTYKEWRAELDARRAKEIAAEEAVKGTSTSSSDDALRDRSQQNPATTTSGAENEPEKDFLATNWWLLLLLGILAIVSARWLASTRV